MNDISTTRNQRCQQVTLDMTGKEYNVSLSNKHTHTDKQTNKQKITQNKINMEGKSPNIGRK